MSNASEIEQSDFIGYLNSRTDAHTLAGAHLAEMANMIADFRSGDRTIDKNLFAEVTPHTVLDHSDFFVT